MDLAEGRRDVELVPGDLTPRLLGHQSFLLTTDRSQKHNACRLARQCQAYRIASGVSFFLILPLPRG